MATVFRQKEPHDGVTDGMFAGVQRNTFLNSVLLTNSANCRGFAVTGQRRHIDDDNDASVGNVRLDKSSASADSVVASTALTNVDLIAVNSCHFVNMTKKMRQQLLSKLLSRLRNQLVMYNVKALFRVYMIYHREDQLIHSICDVFCKKRVYDGAQLRQEIIAKNTKPHQKKIMRNKICNDVMSSNPNILRLFDNRTLSYCRNILLLASDTMHRISNSLPVIMCLNEHDVDVMFERCRSAHSRRHDFPIDLLPGCVRRPFARLLGLSVH